jgi:5'-nucleotidase
MRVLITNDDGYFAPGLAALTRSLAAWAERAPQGERRELVVVAPDQNYSGASAMVGEVYARDGIAFRRVAIEGAEQVEAWSLDAAPALCSLVSCLGALGPAPDVVVSGINLGANIGRSVMYSGTIGAVLSAGQLGCSGLAVSMQSAKGAPLDVAGEVAACVLDELLGAPERTMWNLNVPALPANELKGVRRARISNAGLVKASTPLDAAAGAASMAVGDSGQLRITVGSAIPELGDVSDEEPDDDGALIAAGYATLTPLRGVQEADDLGSDDALRRALGAIEAHLDGAGTPD